MSSGLMSCVRENSPPLKMSANLSSPMSLPEGAGKGPPHVAQAHDNASVSNGDQQKRRRFHPLRNLRRIFRRRTITSVADTNPSALSLPPTSSTSEKNLRSATLSSIASAATASSPSSPLGHPQLQDAYITHSLPKSKSHAGVLSANAKEHPTSGGAHKSHKEKTSKRANPTATSTPKTSSATDVDMYTTTTTAATTSSSSSSAYHHYHQHVGASSQTSERLTGGGGAVASSDGGGAGGGGGGVSRHFAQRQSLGVAVLPSAMNRSFFAERQKLRSMGDSSQDLDSSSNESHHEVSGKTVSPTAHTHTSREMSDSRRSLSEGRLIDSDYSQEPLSHSHDSVFSESATASSLSIVLKAELADVLRKRRSRPDASDEDLGLPRSPVSPQRQPGDHILHTTTTSVSSRSTSFNTTSTSLASGGNHTGVSTLSLLSLNSNDAEDIAVPSSFPGNSINQSQTHSQSIRKSESMVEHSGSSVVTTTTTTTKYSRSAGTTERIVRQTKSANFDESRDEIDLFGAQRQKLSHAAAKHKMAIRPAKKKGPTRHRRTIEKSIPETNEDTFKLNAKDVADIVDNGAKLKTEFRPTSSSNVEVIAKPYSSRSTEISQKSSGSESDAILKSTKPEKLEQAINEKVAAPSSAPMANPSNSFSATNLFGLRNLTNKASAMFDSKEAVLHEEHHRQKHESTNNAEETAESGFLRRLIHRNSKRTISKVNGDEDVNQSEPKKMQISVSSYESRDISKNLLSLDTTKSSPTEGAFNKEMKWDTTGTSTVVNNFMAAEKTQTRSQREIFSASSQKPKSGPAARQRYAPQDITPGGNTLDKKPSLSDLPTLLGSETKRDTLGSPTKQNREVFQSTSIIREITSAQSKAEHHFEKKPKIVGPSTFQHKVYRSNDSLMQTSLNSINNSVNSLETPGEYPTVYYDQKQRKNVEKSRSFRTYDEKVTSPTSSVHNNMPSLPDLTFGLRLPGSNAFTESKYALHSQMEHIDKSVSLGFEINDNNLVKPIPRSESSNTLVGTPNTCAKNVILTTSQASSTKFLTPPVSAVVTSLSPTSARCNKNISEIEQNIDLIVKSPFVSVLRKSNTGEKLETMTNATSPKQKESFERRVRPQVLDLKETTVMGVAEEKIRSPKKVTVPLKENPKELSSPLKNFEPAAEPVKTSPQKVTNSVRRTSSIIDNTCDESNTDVPEFMKIQLNRVRSPGGIAKSNVVLAKNVKESTPVRDVTSEEKFDSSDEPSTRRFSNESVEIIERHSPEKEKNAIGIYEAFNKQAKSSSESVVANIGRQFSETGSPKSVASKSLGTPTTPTTPSSPKNIVTKPLATPTTPPTDSEDAVVLRVRSDETSNISDPATTSNKLSLLERKRLFLAEDKTKFDKKIEELRSERKKSISEEMFRKSATKSEEKPEVKQDEPMEVTEPVPVMLRKKSFATATKHAVDDGATTPRDDATPELIKVFARRSLKIKDEDVDKFVVHQQVITAPTVLGSNAKKSNNQQQQQQHVDSDKENQSASDEKLDKLQYNSEAQVNSAGKLSIVSNSNGNSTNNRNSVADFRHGAEKNGIGLFNNNSKAVPCSLNNGNSMLPPVKVANYRAKLYAQESTTTSSSTKNNSNNNNSMNNNKVQTINNNTTTKSVSSERQAFSLKCPKGLLPNLTMDAVANTTTTASTTTTTKVIERSATVSEFKGIHQRRAEWEQRAKEAFK